MMNLNPQNMPSRSPKKRIVSKNKIGNTSSGMVPAAKNAIFLKKILVPIVFSKAEKATLEYAKSLASLTGAKVYLMHVMERFYPKELSASYIKIDFQALRQKITRDLELLQVDFFKNIRTEMILTDGTPFFEIISTAKKNEVDMIVMSTHGFTGFTRILLGSTAERVVRYADCPVLVVRQKQLRKRK